MYLDRCGKTEYSGQVFIVYVPCVGVHPMRCNAQKHVQKQRSQEQMFKNKWKNVILMCYKLCSPSHWPCHGLQLWVKYKYWHWYIISYFYFLYVFPVVPKNVNCDYLLLILVVFLHAASSDRLLLHAGTDNGVWRRTCFNSSPLDKMAAVSQTIFSDAFPWMKNFIFWLKFHWSLFLRVHLTIIQHWFRWRFGAG